jgi:hypothetical protein
MIPISLDSEWRLKHYKALLTRFNKGICQVFKARHRAGKNEDGTRRKIGVEQELETRRLGRLAFVPFSNS